MNIFTVSCQIAFSQDQRLHAIDSSTASNVVRGIGRYDSLLIHHEELGDSLNQAIALKIDSAIVSINTLIDSLNSAEVSGALYSAKLKGAYDKLQTTVIVTAKAKRDSLGVFLNTKVYELEKAIQGKRYFSDSLLNANELASFKIPNGINTKLPLLKDVPLPSTSGIGSGVRILPFAPPQFPKPDLGLSLPKLPTPNLTVERIKESVANIKQIADKAGNYRKEAIKLKNGDVDVFEKTILSGAAKIDEVAEMNRNISSVETLKNKVHEVTDKVGNKESIKEEIKKGAKKKFVDHFAAHEDKIKSQIESMEKLQRKYHNVKDARYLPKRRTNPEKDKPFIERLIVGTEFQIDNKGTAWTILDVSPYLGYRFSDRFRAHIGGTYRVAFDLAELELKRENETYGYRTFGNYKIFKAWFAHLELENMYRPVPSFNIPMHRMPVLDDSEWVPRALIGVFKTFEIGKRFNGQTQILYDLLEVAREFRFNKVAFRFGFEYRLLKRGPKALAKIHPGA